MFLYQTLLDAAISLVDPDSGFIVLSDPSTNTFEYVATHNFEPINNQYSERMFLALAEAQAALIDNTITLDYLPSGATGTLRLRHVLSIPLKKEGVAYGLLWCDCLFQQDLFDKVDLENLAALVDQFHETP